MFDPANAESNLASKNTNRTPASFRHVRYTRTTHDRQKNVYQVHQNTTDTGNKKADWLHQGPTTSKLSADKTEDNEHQSRSEARSLRHRLVDPDRKIFTWSLKTSVFPHLRTRSTSSTSRAKTTNIDVRPKNCSLSVVRRYNHRLGNVQRK